MYVDMQFVINYRRTVVWILLIEVYSGSNRALTYQDNGKGKEIRVIYIAVNSADAVVGNI